MSIITGTRIKLTRILDSTYGFIYKIDINGNGNGFEYTKSVNGIDIKYIVIFGDVIISSWERKVTTPLIECVQLADDSTTFIKSYPSGVFTQQRLLCDDDTIVDSTTGAIICISDSSTSGSGITIDDIYVENLDTNGLSFAPKQYSNIFKPSYTTEYEFYLLHIGNPVIFNAIFNVIE